MLQLEGVVKRFGAVQGVGPIDLLLRERQTTVLIGPSGCGKSTLLRLLVGLVWPDAGRVMVSGSPLTQERLPALRRQLGYVIQEGGLFPHLTSYENVTLVASHLRWPQSQIDGRLAELAELVRLDSSILRRYPAELSGGQRQRVSLMRALMLDPALLLLDEPLGALDPMIRFELQNDLLGIFRKLAKTVVMVTHDLGEAVHFADEIVLLRDGRIVQQGVIEDLVHRPADRFVEQFVRAQRPSPVLAGSPK